MRVLTISETDDTGEDEADPLLVVQVDGAMIRRVLALIVDELAGPLEGAPHPQRDERAGRAQPLIVEGDDGGREDEHRKGADGGNGGAEPD